MSPKRISLRKISHARATASAQLGRGIVLAFDHPSGNGSISLQQTSGNSIQQWYLLHTDAGVIMLGECEGALNLLSTCPAVLTDDADPSNPETAWYWQLYNLHLAQQIQQTFGQIKQINAPLQVGIPCIIKVSVAQKSASCDALIPSTTLHHLLERGQWHPQRSELPQDWAFSTALNLGITHLPVSRLGQLSRGDIIIATQPLFNIQGEGVIQLANLQIRLKFQGTGAKASYTITYLEEFTMHNTAEETDLEQTLDNSYPEDTSSHYNDIECRGENMECHSENMENHSEDIQSHNAELAHSDTPLEEHNTPATLPKLESVDSLTCTLTIWGGSISTTLNELRRLDVGSVLVAGGESPGFAQIRYGNRTIARGELVDVEGQLGVQITSLGLSQ